MSMIRGVDAHPPIDAPTLRSTLGSGFRGHGTSTTWQVGRVDAVATRGSSGTLVLASVVVRIACVRKPADIVQRIPRNLDQRTRGVSAP
jgi:hypothetical protein